MLALPTSTLAHSSENLYSVEEGWYLGAAVGLGVITNPVYQGKNIPLVIVPRIEYFDGDFSLVNTELVWTPVDSNFGTISLMSRFNRDGVYFITDPSISSIVSVLSGQPPMGLPPSGGSSVPVSDNIKIRGDIDKISSRNLSYMAGLEYTNTWHDLRWSLSWFQDVTANHNGHESFFRIERPFSFKHHLIVLSSELQYQNKELTQYYYGTSEQDLFDAGFGYYQAESSTNVSINIKYQYSWSTYWTFISDFNYQQLGDGIADSSLVDDDQVFSMYFGIAWSY
ncbi:MipA/OmpV family protein [Shewanella sp. 125m-4]